MLTLNKSILKRCDKKLILPFLNLNNYTKNRFYSKNRESSEVVLPTSSPSIPTPPQNKIKENFNNNYKSKDSNESISTSSQSSTYPNRQPKQYTNINKQSNFKNNNSNISNNNIATKKKNVEILFENNNTLKVTPPKAVTNSSNAVKTIPTTFSSNTEGFKNFHKDIQRVLVDMDIKKATKIQEKSIPALQSGIDAYIIDETGTGKSFGVMCEIINRYYIEILKQLEDVKTSKRQTTSIKEATSIKPKFIIISPTRELSWQFGYWCRNLLSKLLPIETSEKYMGKVQLVVNNGLSDELIKKQLLLSEPDILIGTSNMLYPIVVNGLVDLNKLNLLYVDEADQIFQALKADVNLKQKKIRALHPLPSTLLFNEIKRRAREQNHLQKESFNEKVLKIIKQQQQGLISNESEQVKTKYIKTMRPFQTIFSSATIGYTTKKEIKDRDWINSNAEFITALNENKELSLDLRTIKKQEEEREEEEDNQVEDSENQQPQLRDQLSIINRLQHYFISVDSENQMLNGIIDVWDNLKPKIAIGILPNDGNISKVCKALEDRNLNCVPLSSIMDFQKFNLIHLNAQGDKQQQQQLELLSQVEIETKDKEIETKKLVKERERKRQQLIKEQEKNKKQQQQNSTPVEEVDDEIIEEIENKEWKLKEFDNKSVLYLAKEDSIRGIDIENVTHVFILNVIVKPSSYLHMIGRTARMGKKGNVICIYNSSISSKYLNTMNQLNIPFKEEDLY